MDVHALADVWEPVGLQLGVPRGTLITVRVQNDNDPLRCAQSILAILPTIDANALRRLPRAIALAKAQGALVCAAPAPSAPPPPVDAADVPPPYSERPPTFFSAKP